MQENEFTCSKFSVFWSGNLMGNELLFYKDSAFEFTSFVMEVPTL